MASLPSASLSYSQKSKRRKWSREQLLKHLQILSSLSAPLPPDLPHSPPPSRSASPAPVLKRKSDAVADIEHPKRPRTDLIQDPPVHHKPSAPLPPPPQHHRLPAPPPARSEPCEDGEVREDIVIASSSHSPSANIAVACAVPVRRPRRGRPSTKDFDRLHDYYHKAGRMLKYSGDARFWSTYSTTHKEYRPLPDPPPLNSPYHKYGGLIARLELLDALICFTYSTWNKDYSRRSCSNETWSTIDQFLSWCKSKWQAEESINDAEKAFVGLIWMIEAFVRGRKMAYAVKTHLDKDVTNLLNDCKTLMAAAAEGALANPPGSNGTSQSTGSQATPPMLPSPASIAPANSANSTPASHTDGTPNATNPPATSSAPVRLQTSNLPTQLLSNLPGPKIPHHVSEAMLGVTVAVGPLMVQELKDRTAGIASAAIGMATSQNTLNLPIMARHFPNTFARMVHSYLSPNEEYEPDIEDDEGELFWPGQSVTGEGIGWVCLMGRAMIKEFGKAYGYRGLKGVVPKPQLEEEGNSGPSTPAQGQGRTQSVRPEGVPQGMSVQR